MTTTSLEVSRQLQDAGFWDGRDCASWHYAPNRTLEYRPYLLHGYTPAATLDDLVPALGLDKPWKYGSLPPDMYFSVQAHVSQCGLTPDTLARVWLDLHDKKALPDMIITKPPTEGTDA